MGPRAIGHHQVHVESDEERRQDSEKKGGKGPEPDDGAEVWSVSAEVEGHHLATGTESVVVLWGGRRTSVPLARYEIHTEAVTSVRFRGGREPLLLLHHRLPLDGAAVLERALRLHRALVLVAHLPQHLHLLAPHVRHRAAARLDPRLPLRARRAHAQGRHGGGRARGGGARRVPHPGALLGLEDRPSISDDAASAMLI